MKVYKAPIIASIQSFYGDLLYPDSSISLYTHLSNLSNKMYEGLRQKEKCTYVQLNNYNPNYLGISTSKLQETKLDLEDCQQTIASEYGFNSWVDVKIQGQIFYDNEFEAAVNAIIYGDLNSLRNIIQKYPNLVTQHSQYGHEATLLHYTASNGVEMWRQQVPENLAKIIDFLIEEGADKEAKMRVYGGRFTAYQLYTTSAHPNDAKLDPSTSELLKV